MPITDESMIIPVAPEELTGHTVRFDRVGPLALHRHGKRRRHGRTVIPAMTYRRSVTVTVTVTVTAKLLPDAIEPMARSAASHR